MTDEHELNKKITSYFKLNWKIVSYGWQLPDGSFGGINDGPSNFTQSLDDLFKWVVPKLKYEEIVFSAPDENGRIYCEILSEQKMFYGNGTSQALALCLAVENLIDEEAKG